jgi:hypothetical protein
MCTIVCICVYVQVRLQAFHENLAPILAVYRQQLLTVPGDGDKADIFHRIQVCITALTTDRACRLVSIQAGWTW